MITSGARKQFREKFVMEAPAPDLMEVVEWIGSVLDPSDVFPNDILQDWALKNGFVRDEQPDNRGTEKE